MLVVSAILPISLPKGEIMSTVNRKPLIVEHALTGSMFGLLEGKTSKTKKGSDGKPLEIKTWYVSVNNGETVGVAGDEAIVGSMFGRSIVVLGTRQANLSPEGLPVFLLATAKNAPVASSGWKSDHASK